jgi:DNA polymerase III subunit epsilon
MDESRSLYECEFCALDIETTGINPYSERIVEIGLVVFSFDRTISGFESLINPGRRIPSHVSSIHGITDEMVASSPRIENILPDIIRFAGSRPLVIHNSRFDLSFIEMECRRSEIDVPSWISFDTVTFAKKTFPDLPNHKLDTLCRVFGIDLSHHRAMADASGCMQVFRECIKGSDPLRTWSFRDLCIFQSKVDRSGSIRELSFKERRGGRISVGKPAVIRYIDSEGNTTERKIFPKKIFKQGKQTIIFAFCCLRNEDRYFKSSRIDEVIEN